MLKLYVWNFLQHNSDRNVGILLIKYSSSNGRVLNEKSILATISGRIETISVEGWSEAKRIGNCSQIILRSWARLDEEIQEISLD